jgi:hypothetical protein
MLARAAAVAGAVTLIACAPRWRGDDAATRTRTATTKSWREHDDPDDDEVEEEAKGLFLGQRRGTSGEGDEGIIVLFLFLVSLALLLLLLFVGVRLGSVVVVERGEPSRRCRQRNAATARRVRCWLGGTEPYFLAILVVSGLAVRSYRSFTSDVESFLHGAHVEGHSECEPRARVAATTSLRTDTDVGNVQLSSPRGVSLEVVCSFRAPIRRYDSRSRCRIPSNVGSATANRSGWAQPTILRSRRLRLASSS